VRQPQKQARSNWVPRQAGGQTRRATGQKCYKTAWRQIRILSLPLAVVLLVGMLTSCSASTSSSLRSISVTPDLTVTLRGTGVRVTARAVPGVTASLAGRARQGGSRVSSALVALAPAERLAASGRLPHGDAVITFRINPQKVPVGAVPFLATLDPAADSWIPVPSRYDRRTGEISARVAHFSIWAPLAWLKSRLAALLKGALLSLFSLGGYGNAPSCSKPTLPVIDSQPNQGVGVCARAISPADVLVKVVDERAYPFDLLYPPGARASEPSADPAALLGAEMHNIASRWHTRILLPGGSEADLTIKLPVGQNQALDTEFDGEAWVLSLIWTGINLLVQTIPASAGVTIADKWIKRLGEARCFADLVDTAHTASLSLTTAQNLGSAAFDCLAAVAKGFGGQVLTVSSILASLVTGVISGAWAAIDVVFGNASHALAVERPRPPPVAPPSVTVCTSPALTCTGAESTNLRTEPMQIVTSADGSIYLKEISWSGWGSATATGTGTLEINNCKPNCATGAYTGYPATVTLSSLAAYDTIKKAYSTMVISAPTAPIKQTQSFSYGLVP
jgi:hypothetical protein